MANEDSKGVELHIGDKVAAILHPSAMHPEIDLGVVAGFTPANVKVDIGPHTWKPGRRVINTKHRYVTKITKEWYEASI